MPTPPSVLHLVIEDNVFFFCQWEPVVAAGLAALDCGAAWDPAMSAWLLPLSHSAQAAVIFSSLGFTHGQIMRRPPLAWAEMMFFRLDDETARVAYRSLKPILEPHRCGRDDYLAELEEGASFVGMTR